MPLWRRKQCSELQLDSGIGPSGEVYSRRFKLAECVVAYLHCVYRFMQASIGSRGRQTAKYKNRRLDCQTSQRPGASC